MSIRTILNIFGVEGSGMSYRGLLSDLLAPCRLESNDTTEPWRLGVQPKPIIYHNPILKPKFVKIFKGHYFSIGDYT